MPHKHKRRGNGDDDYDLPPTSIAKSLPTRLEKSDVKSKGGQGTKKEPKQKRSSTKSLQDDTPKAFARLMRVYQESNGKRKQGDRDAELDSSEQNSRKRKRQNDTNQQKAQNKNSKAKAAAEAKDANIPKILPGERISEFAARVDRALPFSELAKRASLSKGGKDAVLGKIRDTRQTKHEKRLLRLQSQWREEDRKFREKRQAEIEEAEGEEEEINDLWKEWEREAGAGVKGKSKKTSIAQKKKKKKKKGMDDGDGDDHAISSDDDDDPWAKLNKRATVTKPINPADVVQAPPEKLAKPREIFKVRGMGGAKVHVADVPAAAGSLRRREELASERQSIVEQYRKLMASKRE
ncbi:hypothetical protein TMEN_9305 [Trichophyton mentagrophytes]|uniref:Urease accessory protein UreD n=1 Tax=Trichophyton interdigitale (strain MR816) TaxID=1215338 RepID=A0A059J6K0_TRIIM|nr:hypothetical protein H101_00620 [Trichophyton interdigitale H6]KDB23102.1 hypothetical protein H109_05000 [Trichophyton interdigitale MR816]GBF66585.1 hypothetical protein TMEN_9305 [Trichophyton mentagrophytes]